MKVIVLGVDENGLGPALGPLVITGVLVEVEREDQLGTTGPIMDSKKVFTRSARSYATGESLALGIAGAAGQGFSDPGQLLKTVGLFEATDPDEVLRWFPEVKLPVWAQGPAEELASGPRIIGVRSLVIPVGAFNRLSREWGNKFNLDLWAFVKLAEALSGFDLGLFGKIGSRRSYARLLRHMTARPVKTLFETKLESRYQLGRGSWRFIKDADSRFWPVAAASVLGKYLRELSMLHLNRLAGREETVPWCSGYGGREDEKVVELVRTLLSTSYREDEILRES